MKMRKQIIYQDYLNKKFSYKNIKLLKIFLTKQGKILPRQITRLKIQQQKKVAKTIKRARLLSLLPFISSNSIF